MARNPVKKRPKRPQELGLLDRVEDISFEDEGLKVSLYGRSGTGKTTFWSTFPKPILAVICSGGKRSGELRSIQNIKQVMQFKLQETGELLGLCEEVEQQGKFATIVLDHATYLQDMRIKEILGIEDTPAQKSWGLVTRQQYGQCSLTMKEYLRCLLDLTANVVIVTQEREFNTEQDSELIVPFVGPALTPSVTGWLNPACDYIFQTFIRTEMVQKKIKIGGKTKTRQVQGKGVEYCLRTGPGETYTTKFRVPRGHKLPDVIVDPNYGKVLKVIQG